MMKTTAILVCLLMIVALPAAVVGLADADPTATDTTCVSVNQDPTHPVDVGSCPAGGQASNIL